MELNVDELKEGMVLERTIERANGILILSKGTKLTQGNIQRLKKLSNIKFAEDESSSIEEIDETVDLDLKSATEDSLKEFIENPNDSNMQKIEDNTNKIVKCIEDDEDIQYDLEMYLKQTKDTSLSSRCVRVACFSVLLAKLYNNTLKSSNQKDLINLKDIAIAAVLQDVGTMYKDNKKLEKIKEIPSVDMIAKIFPGIKDTPLDKYDEKYSTVYSYCAIADMKNVSTTSKLMLLLSKEPETGDGCLRVPNDINTKRSSAIYGGKIIHICNIYDNAMKQAIDNRTSLEEVVSELSYDAKNGIINSEIENLLMNKVRLYPIKTRVILSSGAVAVVEKSRLGQQDSYKPVVHTRPYPGREIDLKETTNITIKSIISKEMFRKLIKDQIQDMKCRIVKDDIER